MRISRYFLFLALLWAFNLSAQEIVVGSGLSIGIDSGLVVNVSGKLQMTSTLRNDGMLTFMDTLMVSTYRGDGSLIAGGADQHIYLNGDTVAILDATGGLKVLHGNLTVDSLFLSSASIVTDTNRLLITGAIEGFGTDSYIIGALARTGSDSLVYPIGDATTYTPVVLSSISGTSPVIAVGYVTGDPTATAGYGLLDVSANQYWQVSEASGTFTSALVQLPTINETVVTDIAEASVAYGTATGERFTGLGNASTTGTIASGSVLSETPGVAGIYAIGRYFDETLRVQDSLALVSIYENAGGANWTASSGWTTANLDGWDRISLFEKRVTEVNLSFNNLVGVVPDISSGLELVTNLNLSNNELTDIGDLSNLSSLATLGISNNRLQFGTLEPIIFSGPDVTYTPQKELLERIRTLQAIDATYTLDRTISGTDNVYSWTQNGNALAETAGSFDITIDDFTADGRYVAKVTNPNVPLLELTTAPILLRVSSLERDSAALIAVYDSLNGANSTLSDWKNLPINEWTEVVFAGERVSAIDLSSAGLSGNLPEDITDIQSLVTANLSDNDIEGLPVLVGYLPNMTGMNVSGNKLTFEDLEPNAELTTLNYADQQLFGTAVRDTMDVGSTITIDLPVGGVNNTYQWYYTTQVIEDQLIDTLTTSSFTIDSLNFHNMGRYELRVTNSLVPNLTLTSQPQMHLAWADLGFNALDLGGEEFIAGESYALMVKPKGQPYDTVQAVRGAAGEGFLFENLILGNYLIAVAPDNLEEFLPTYYKNTDLWSEADTLLLREDRFGTLNMAQIPPEGQGTAQVSGTVESDFADEGGRIEARRKVKRAGCSVRRFVPKGRTDQEDGEFVLYAYVQSNDEGVFEFTDLEEGLYRFNIEYPGIPMDEDSYVEFTIGEGGIEDEELILQATVTEDGIVVEKIERLGFYRKYFQDLSVYPNPADSYVRISYGKLMSADVTVRLIDLQGNVIREQQIAKGYDQELDMDVSGISGGIYILNFVDSSKGSENITTFKVIVNH